MTQSGGDIPAGTHNGLAGCGVVFHIAPTGAESVVHTFFCGPSGRQPFAGLLDVGGIWYGTTSEGGRFTNCVAGCGDPCRIDESGHHTVLHRFNGGAGSDGANPLGELLSGADGSIYGTTAEGGTGSCPGCGAGTIFKYTP